MFKKYVEPTVAKEAEKEMKEMGFSSSSVVPVDKDYAYVPTNLSQTAKESSTNVNKSAKMNLKRFGLGEQL